MSNLPKVHPRRRVTVDAELRLEIADITEQLAPFWNRRVEDGEDPEQALERAWSDLFNHLERLASRDDERTLRFRATLWNELISRWGLDHLTPARTDEDLESFRVESPLQ